MNKKVFEDFINEHFPERKDELMKAFQNYLEMLWETNTQINLISRKTPEDEYWTLHMLDSILPASFVNFSNLRILDFGSGGGLPGIPIKLLFPTCEVHLLDSITKKMLAVKNIIKSLDVQECFTIVSRLEDMEEKWDGYFDLIVCRSVKILPKYKNRMLGLLKRKGKILLYKSRLLEDADLFRNVQIHEVNHPQIGERKIVEITKW